MQPATADDVAELLGERADEAIVERIVALDATIEEVSEAIDDLEYERRFGEPREASSPRVEEVRQILEELPVGDLDAEDEIDTGDEDELSVIEIDENEREAP